MYETSLEKMVGKALSETKVFSSVGTFKAFHAAERFCEEQGFSVGRMCGPLPVGIKRGDWDIQKWRNLSTADRKLMDGVIVGDLRDGPVTVLFCEQ